jgi:hypothetical protein
VHPSQYAIRHFVAVFAPALTLLVLTTVQASQPSSDWLIVPGLRVGPIAANTTEAMLVEMLGSDTVKPFIAAVGEGTTVPATAVYGSDPERRIEVVWLDDTRTVAKSVRLSGGSSKWKTKEGISLGTTLRELERLNGGPFRLSGFGTDVSGTVISSGDGRLQILGHGDPRSRNYRLLLVRLTPHQNARFPTAAQQVVGDRAFSSGHPAMQALNPSIREMIVYLHRQ